MKKIVFFILSFIISITLTLGIVDRAGINIPLLKVEKALALSGPTAGWYDNPLLTGSTISVNKSSYKIDKTIKVKIKAYFMDKKMSGAFCIVSLYWFPYFDETYTQIPIYLDKKGRGTVKFGSSPFLVGKIY